MSYQYFETETETEERHGDDEDQEVIYEQMLVDNGVISENETVAALETAAAKRAVEQAKEAHALVALVCSCGSVKCYMVRRFGLPRPMFSTEIEPVFPQSSRDRKALAIKGSR